MREKRHLTGRGKNNLNDNKLLKHGAKRKQNIFQVPTEKNYQSGILYLAKIPFRNAEEYKTFSDEEKLREFISINPTFKNG